MATQATTRELIPALQKAITKSVRESIRSEFMRIRSFGMPSISEKEQENAEQLYKKASNTKNFLSLAGTLGSRVKLSDRKLRKARDTFHTKWHDQA